jgi:predicted ribosome quality control (RQC) complex YloA/Tae2 family protein
MLLKVGRHLRPKTNFKLIISREEGENNYLSGYKNEYLTLQASSHKGPLTLLDGDPTSEDITLAARIVARYGQERDADLVNVDIRTPSGDLSTRSIKPLLADDIDPSWHV